MAVRFQVLHCRDNAAQAGTRWDIWSVAMDDPKAEPVWHGYGAYEDCLMYVCGVLKLRTYTNVRGGIFQCPYPERLGR